MTGFLGPGTGTFIINQNVSLDKITAQMTLAGQYVFGSSAIGGTGVTPICNANDLAANFRHYQDAGGLPVPLLNSQMERYQPFTSSQNFVFASDSLQLTATLDPGQNATVQGSVTPGAGIHLDGTTVNLFSNYPSIDPTRITVGQLLAVQFVNGVFYINSVIGTTSFTCKTVPNFGGSSSNQFNKSIAFLPAYFTTLSSGYTTGDTILSITSLPTGVVNGMAVSCDSAANGTMFWGGQSYVTGMTLTTVTIDVPNGNGSFANGSSVFFTPAIRSGQFWTTQYYATGFDSVKALVMELDCLLPGSGTCVRYSNVNPSSFPTTAPYGAWSAFWTYSGNTGGTWEDTSEIDIMEIVNSSTVDSTVYTGLVRGTMTPLAFVRSTSGGTWQSNGTLNFRNVDLSLARHKFALLWTPDTTYRYLDSEMLSADYFRWGSGDKAQIGVDMSAGSLSKSDAANLQFPYNSACFPYAFSIYSLKVWELL